MRPSWSWCSLVLLALAMSLAAPVGSRADGPDRSHVLFISSFPRDIPAQAALDRGLTDAYTGGIEIHFEFLDQRLPHGDIAEGLAALVARKYRGVRLSAIVAWGLPAAELASAIRPTVGDPPIILLEISEADASRLIHPGARDVNLIVRPAYERSLGEALRLSKAERIVLVGETKSPSGAVRFGDLSRALETIDPKIPVELELDQPLDMLVERAAALPPRTMIFYFLIFGDGRGAAITPFEAARRLAESSGAPIFSAWESLMGSGVVGGYVLSHETMGREISKALRAITRGETPPTSVASMRLVYDWSLIERWGWSRRDVAEEAVMLNPPLNRIEQYRWHIVAAVAVIAILAVLVVLLARALRSRNAALDALSRERTMLAERVGERTAALTASTRDLERSNAELEQFAYVVSHDLRQPLRMVASYLTLLERRLGGSLDEECRTFMAFAVDGAKRMDALIMGILEYARVGRRQVPFEEVPLADVIRDVTTDLSSAISAADGTLGVAPDLPSVRGNRIELTRLFENLLGNALKYRAADRPSEIEVGWRREGAECAIWVRDNGIGIAPADHDRAFGIFQRLVPDRAYEGTGIGLAVCRKIVEHHGGRIWIESDIGLGSRFFVALPAPR